jgi:2-keto-4-pentenoate hydratase/2-oxohepta-3-ene-1,7-dioic acid hydratase in catechol pathway
MPGNSGGQFFYAKAFDKFAPLGPTLLSPELFKGGKGLELITRVNGHVMQKSEFVKEFIFSPTEILSHMSQGWSLSIFLACFPVSPKVPASDTKTA